ncbi:hypothetical protein C8Q74DRAFT_1372500 [Fomes fomentarius]|nr:hypothetical protein C8Q74DRAFT_1372500 [Fomes fomentarius]
MSKNPPKRPFHCVLRAPIASSSTRHLSLENLLDRTPVFSIRVNPLPGSFLCPIRFSPLLPFKLGPREDLAVTGENLIGTAIINPPGSLLRLQQ